MSVGLYGNSGRCNKGRWLVSETRANIRNLSICCCVAGSYRPYLKPIQMGLPVPSPLQPPCRIAYIQHDTGLLNKKMTSMYARGYLHYTQIIARVTLACATWNTECNLQGLVFTVHMQRALVWSLVAKFACWLKTSKSYTVMQLRGQTIANGQATNPANGYRMAI